MIGKTTRKIVAIIGLILICVFTVTLPIYLAKPDIWSGRIATVALYSGIFGVLFFFIIWLDNKAIKQKQDYDEIRAKGREEYEKNKKRAQPCETDESQRFATTNKGDCQKDDGTPSQNCDKKPTKKLGKNDLSDDDLA
ncbi:MAG: hypothetical protein IJD07_00550 [Clostridia bacterium]|nr:hypothetical protein [Clostridia bacterium]